MAAKAVKVLVRIRPFPEAREGCPSSQASWLAHGQDWIALCDPADPLAASLSNVAAPASPAPCRRRRYDFDCVLGPGCSQSEIFENCRPLVHRALKGLSGCVLAYGPTGSGKTYTMRGACGGGKMRRGEAGKLARRRGGIVPRAVDALFDAVEEQPADTYRVSLTALELHSDRLKDLLAVDERSKHPLPIEADAARRARAEIKLLSDGSVVGSRTFQTPVSNRHEMHELLARADAARSVGATAGNESSSRSHQLIRVEVERVGDGLKGRTAGRLDLVDLAGLEPLEGTSAHLQETIAINSSLAALCDMVGALSRSEVRCPPAATHFHVHNLRQPATRLESPFPNPGMARDAMGALWAPVLTVPLSSQASHKPSVRANKLTHLLVGSVGGTSSTVFIATVCSDEHARQRTHKTLEIAARAANVRGQPVVRQCWTQLRQGQAQVGRGGGVGYGVPS
ncbi:MAG: hypothetical protein SGPRY_007834 [Prymnesium sp.]